MDDRERWNQRYADGSHTGGTPHSWALECADALPKRGRALDLAGGAGALALWLATRGLSVTLADVSDRGLELASQRAAEAEVSLRCERIDLTDPVERERLGSGWDLVTCTNYFQAELFPWIAEVLAPQGLCLFAQPTLKNLERHARPSARFLVDPLSLDAWLGGLQVLERYEGWTASGTHELRLLARRSH
ncbi:MAG: methyltransferase domain-containing protein [Polyangiaceae bacterium]|nr:methyltransferase domain-containing protein [Myxococcales bacterium]MCB9589893.1 methyltransferase domain-containing protein [Polyangiaceae bacterium]MCB9610404.1 methyltransferase domain-containing protein [Polyangiaceae bacterium]